MEPDSPFYARAATWAQRYADRVIAHDNLHLSPTFITKAAAKRISQGIKAIEAYLRRLLLLLALQIEPTLKPSATPRPVYGTKGPEKAAKSPAFSLRAFPKEGIDSALSYKFVALRGRERAARDFTRRPVPARPYLERMRALRALLNDPYTRARRLAWIIARRRPGLLLAPGAADAVRNRYGTEFSAIYAAMSAAILTRSRARPPPLGPAPKCPPRIRCL